MASTVIVPLSNVAFSLKFIPGHQPLRRWDIVGLFVIMSGLVIYRFNKEMLQAYQRCRGLEVEDDETEKLKGKGGQLSKLLKDAERKQLKYLGLNQVESLQALVDVRIMKETTKLLFRSPQQIRGNFFTKIGIPPSPLISMGPGNRLGIADQEKFNNAKANYQATGYSPMIYGSSLERSNSFKQAKVSNNYNIISSTPKSMSKGNKAKTNANSNTFSYGTNGQSTNNNLQNKFGAAKSNQKKAAAEV
jgi:hypothetical protein